MRYFAILVLLLGCGCRLDPDCDPPPFVMPPLLETQGGVKVYVPPIAEALYGRAVVLAWVDIRVQQWIGNKPAWGLEAFDDATLWAFARQYPVIGYDGYVVPGDNPHKHYSGYNWYGVRIEIAVEPIDTSGVGLMWLPHEFTHSVLYDFH